jgi:hypothetical protein
MLICLVKGLGVNKPTKLEEDLSKIRTLEDDFKKLSDISRFLREIHSSIMIIPDS